jgi:hypothetical protein
MPSMPHFCDADMFKPDVFWTLEVITSRTWECMVTYTSGDLRQARARNAQANSAASLSNVQGNLYGSSLLYGHLT